MKVRKVLSSDELFEKVKEYDIVFTADASMMSALNDRLRKPRLAYFAVTPLIYVSRAAQNEEVLREKELFKEVVKNTDISWKQASYLLENSIDCWEHTGEPDTILQYEAFNTPQTKKILRVLRRKESIYQKMHVANTPSSKKVAVINIDEFNELDKKVLPNNYDAFTVFTDKQKSLPEFSVFPSTTNIVNTLTEYITPKIAHDVGIVLSQDSEYSAAIESALHAENIPVMSQDTVNEDETLRTLIQLLRLGLNNKRRTVKECRPLLQKLGVTVDIKKDNDYISDLHGDIDTFKQLLQSIPGSTLQTVYEHIDIHSDVREQLRYLDVEDKEITPQLLNKIEYYFDTYTVKKEKKNKGVLLAEATSSSVVNRPVVFYIGLDSSWEHNTSSKPWVDKDQEADNNLRAFKQLLQQGEQQYYLVQNTMHNEDVTPCVYFNELTTKEFETFTDLPHTSYEKAPSKPDQPFEKEQYNVQVKKAETFSQSSLSTFITSPKQYLFDKVTTSSDQDYFRKGTLYHDYAEFYATHPETLKNISKDKIIPFLLQEMKSIVDPIKLDLLRTEFNIALTTIETFIDQHREKIQPRTPTESKGKNVFAEKYGENITHTFTEAWFENKDLGTRGIVDLVISPEHIVDYKSGRKKTPKNIIQNSKLDTLKGRPNFQAILYLLQQRHTNPDQKITFTFFHFLDNIDQAIHGENNIQNCLTNITYYPDTKIGTATTQDVYNHIIKGVSASNDRRKTVEKLGYNQYKAFFQTQTSLPQNKKEIKDAEITVEFIKHCKEHVGNYKYVEKGCRSALKKIIGFTQQNYFKPDLDHFEQFLHQQIQLLNTYKETTFPKTHPDIEQDLDIDMKDMIPL